MFERQTKATLEVKKFCHDIRRAKTTILPVNNILMRFFAWNSFHLPKQFVFKQLYALFCAFCWEPFANK